MTGLAKVIIEKKNGALGAAVQSNDGESLLIIGSLGLVGNRGVVPETLDIPTEVQLQSYLSLEDFLQSFSIDYDVQLGMLYKHHVEKYFEASSSKLHIMRIDKSKSMTDLFTPADADYIRLKNYLKQQNGAIKLIGVANNPVEVETVTNGISADLNTAINIAGNFANAEFQAGRPVHILLEGRNIDFTDTDLINLRTKTAGSVSVVAWQNTAVGLRIPLGTEIPGGSGPQVDPVDFVTNCTKYAEVGYTLGLLSAIPVQRNLGRVKNGALSYSTGIASSSGQSIDNISSAVLNSIAEKGYIFPVQHPQLDGYYLSDDATCVVKSDDYAWITRNRVINKAAAITRRVYNQSILDEVFTDPDTGKLSALTIKNFESEVDQAITNEMVRLGEATAVETYVNPDQDVITTGEIVVDVRIVPVGIARYITAKIGFSKTI